MHHKRWLAALLLLAMLLSPMAQAKEEILYAIEIDIVNQIVTVFENVKDHGEEHIVRQMICSTGTGSKTPTGTFTMPKPRYAAERTEWYYFGDFDVYAKYASRIYEGILFHSILYDSKHSGPTWGSTHALGSKASHGCIRLRVDDAKWIADNCPPGTKVRIFDGAKRNEELRGQLLGKTFIASELDYADYRAGLAPLSRGSRSSSVTFMQRKLIELGYLNDVADGIFGENTQQAVLAWQEAHGEEASGSVGMAQLKRILADNSPLPTPEPTPTPEITPQPSATPVPAEPPEATETIEPTPTPGIGHIPGVVARAKVSSNVRLRALPSLDADILAALENGEPMQVLIEGMVWSKVAYKEHKGWINSKYIEIVRPADAEEETK